MTKEEKIQKIIDSIDEDYVFILEKDGFTVEDFLHIYDGKSLFDYIIDKEINNKNIFIDYEIKNIIFQSFELTLKYITNSIGAAKKNFLFIEATEIPTNYYFQKINENETLIEYILNNNINLYDLDEVDDIRMVEILFKYKNGDIKNISNERLNEYFSSFSLEELLEFMKDDFFVSKIFPKLYIEKLINYLINNKKFDLLINLREEPLLKEFGNTTLLEVLLNNGYEPNFSNSDIVSTRFTDTRIYDILLKYDKLDLIIKYIKFDLLMEHVDLNVTRLDTLVEKYLENPYKYNFLISGLGNLDDSEKAKLYIEFAKKNLSDHLPKIDEFDIWTDLINELIKLDKDITLSKIISRDLLKNPDFIIKLNMCGVLDKTSELKNSSEYTEQLIEQYNINYANITLDDESSQLLEQFETLMNDGKSDPDLIGILITSYKKTLATNKSFGMAEIQQLIKIKTQNPDKFIYKKIDSGAYFSPSSGCVCMDSTTISTLDHETGHAIHHYLADGKDPINFNEIMSKLLYDEEILRKVNNYSKQFNRLKDKILFAATAEYERKFKNYYTPEKILEIEEFLKESKEKKLSELNSNFRTKDISESVLAPILDNVYSTEKYIEAEKNIYIREFADSYLRTRYPAFIALGDIFDAIYKGKFRSNELERHNDKIQGAYGHGLRYYSNEDKKFTEIIANYSSIIKSPNSNKALEIMNDVFGKEFMDMINDFYYNEILNSKKYVDKLDEFVGGNYER